jgi:hypothetical protein
MPLFMGQMEGKSGSLPRNSLTTYSIPISTQKKNRNITPDEDERDRLSSGYQTPRDQ